MSLEEKAAHVLMLEATRSGRGTGSDDEELDAIPLSEEEVYKRDVDALPDAPDMDGTFAFLLLFFFFFEIAFVCLFVCLFVVCNKLILFIYCRSVRIYSRRKIWRGTAQRHGMEQRRTRWPHQQGVCCRVFIPGFCSRRSQCQ
jgi:hypothetical protein